MSIETNNISPNQLKLFEASQYLIKRFILPNVVEVHFGSSVHSVLSEDLDVEADVLPFPPSLRLRSPPELGWDYTPPEIA